MTAEIAILNRSGVALAADSAATVSATGLHKIYHSVNKLFALSKYHPVGIMIHGAADFMNVPWETIIKQYREQIGIKKKDYIPQYGSDFVRYLKKYIPNTEEEQKKNIFRIWCSYFEILDEEILSEVRRALRESKGKKTISDQDRQEIVGDVIARHAAAVSELEDVGFDKKLTAAQLLKMYSDEFENALQLVLGVWPIKGAALTKLKQYAGNILTKEHFSTASSGIVIAGFGEKEIFPSLVSFRTDGVFGGQIKIKQVNHTDISRDHTASIQYFAQGEMVARFIEGVDPAYQQYLGTAFFHLLQQFGNSIVEAHVKLPDNSKRKLKKKVDDTAYKTMVEFFERADAYRHNRFVDPIMTVADFLPKEEIANLAESLVNLTSLKRKVSMEAETVGGPIDVAIISKGDGFIWIKRKHYFSPEFNPQFFANYYRAHEDRRKGADHVRAKQRGGKGGKAAGTA